MPKKTSLQKEWEKNVKQEERFLCKRLEKQDSFLNQKLEGKIPPKLQDTLDAAFEKAFSLIFEKGMAVIEKTYRKEKITQDYQINEYIASVREDKKSLRSVSKAAKNAGTKNLLLAGASGMGMGVLGIGIPDIPVFTGMILRNIYEIAMNHGYTYESEAERYFILLLIEGALSCGENHRSIDQRISQFIEKEEIPNGQNVQSQVQETAAAVSRELLYMKFLQGIPVVGVVGGAYDAIYMNRITEYAVMKYRHRYLRSKRML